MNELDLEDLESRLYSQVYHSLNDETPTANLQEYPKESLPQPTNAMRKSGGRYFGPWSPASKSHKNAPAKNSLKSPGRRDSRQEGFYNKSFGKPLTPEISIDQVVVVSPTEPTSYMNSKERSRARWKLRLKEKVKQRKALRRAAKLMKRAAKHEDVITLSDSEDDSCVIVDNKWPVLSVADSDDEKAPVPENNKEKCSDNDSKTELVNTQQHTLNESLSDDVIFVEPVVAPIEVITLCEDNDTNKEKHSETASSASSDSISINTPTKNTTRQLHQERKELLRTPDSASNDFMNNSGVELNQNNFNFSLHGSDFNNGEFLKPAPPTETCETESSSSTADMHSGNLMKTIVFNEVDFPKDDIFSENNLESFGNFITPLRNNASVTTVQSSPLKLPESHNKTVYSSDSSSESDLEDSQIEKQKDVAQKLKSLPELSPMQSKQNNNMSVTKKTKKMSNLGSKYDLINAGAETPTKDVKTKNPSKKKKKNKKRKSGNEENFSSFEKTGTETVTDDVQVEEDLKKKKRRSSQMESAEGVDNHAKKRNLSVNNDSVVETHDKLAPVVVLNLMSTANEGKIEDVQSENSPIEENTKTEVMVSVGENVHVMKGVDHPNPAINNSLQAAPDKQHDETVSELEHVENIKTENDERSLQKSETLASPLDGLVIVEEVFSESTPVILSDAESVLSPLQEQSDIKLNCEESISEERVCLTVEFGMDLNNFTVAELQLKMSNDPKLWTILDSDRSPSRRNRGRRCNRCKQFGHVGIRCTSRVEPKCSLCGGVGHFEPRCPNKLCTQCGQRSPYSTTYCSSCFKIRNYRCQICSMMGHLPNTCPDLWRRYHLTTTEGPITTYNGPPLKEKNQLWCSGCARSGHLEHSCRFYKSIYPPTDPFIKSYEETYKDVRTRQEKPLQYSPPQSYHTNNQLYQPVAPRQVFAGSCVQRTQNNYNQMNPQFVNPFMDGVFVANQQNFFPSVPTNLLQFPQNHYPPTHNQFVFENALPTFISFDSQAPSNNSYQEVPQLKGGSRYFKAKRSGKVANSMFFNSSAIQLQQFINEELHRLTRISLKSSKLVQEVRKMRVPTDFEMLNMLLFGVFNLRDGKTHLEKLKHFSWTKKSKVDAGTRRRLHVAYSYIFGRDSHPDVDYNELLRIV